jgi:hypothetical protein
VEGAEVVLGFIPASLVTKLTDEEGHWRAVPAAAEELCAVIRNLSEPEVDVLSAKLDPFLRMLTALLRETQFRSVMALLKTVEVSDTLRHCGTCPSIASTRGGVCVCVWRRLCFSTVRHGSCVSRPPCVTSPVQAVIDKVRGGVWAHSPLLLPLLFERLGDTKTIVRQVCRCPSCVHVHQVSASCVLLLLLLLLLLLGF